jgi:hypothetical protein
MGHSLPENKVIKELELIIHEAKRADEVKLEQLDHAYQNKLRLLAYTAHYILWLRYSDFH